MIIAVVGTGKDCPPNAFALAEAVGREIAQRGHTVICGGLNGVMEGACKGAKQAGGATIGILPGEDPSAANRYVDIPIATGMGYARNLIVVRSAAAVIAIDGAYGTLSEVAHALGFSIPVVGLKTWRITRPEGFIDPGVIVTDNPAEAVERAVHAAGANGRHPG
jgi:uncharacterized protein (TIGR00725 family)